MIFQIAWRYLWGKKSTQAIQLIAWVSMLAMAVGTAALLVVLSVFNGFESFIKELYSDFYPDIRMTAKVGKTFSLSPSFEAQIQALPNVDACSHTLEEKVLLNFDENQVIATLKGIDRTYDLTSHFSRKIKYGSLPEADSQHHPPLVLGLGLSNRLAANEESGLPLLCYSFRKEAIGMQVDPTSVYNTQLFMVSGIYMLQEEIDQQYAFTHLDEVQALTGQNGQLSAIELKLHDNTLADETKKELQQLPGATDFKIETRYEQNRTLYFIMQSERWAVFAILTLMLIIASFNIIGSLSMLVIEKEKDIAIFQAMGMNKRQIRNIFLLTGILMAIIGAGIGSILALVLLWGQQAFGWIKLGQDGAFLIEAYPVDIQAQDFVLIYSTVLFLAMLASFIPAMKASKKSNSLRIR